MTNWELEILKDQVEIAKKALEEIVKNAPITEQGLEEAQSGGNFDDAYYGGSNDEHFRLAKIAREALVKLERAS